jgi:hypothetical protein
MRQFDQHGRVAAGLLLLLVAGCSGPLDEAPQAVRSALDPLAKSGYSCSGATTDNSAYGQWKCSRTSPEKVVYYVVLDANASAIKQVLATVDQSNVSSVDRSMVADFFHEVTDLEIGGSSQTIREWVDAHIADGGQEQLGPVFVTLDGLRPVAHLTLFVSG